MTSQAQNGREFPRFVYLTFIYFLTFNKVEFSLYIVFFITSMNYLLLQLTTAK